MAKHSAEEIAASTRQQLRAIVRLTWDLRRPVPVSESIEREEGPCWLVSIEPGTQWSGRGLRLGEISELEVPDERVIDQGYELAGHIYHLKDRLHQYVRAAELPSRKQDHPLHVSKIVERSEDLRVCGDLINLKKHGRNDNLSKRSPSLGNVVLDTSVCGVVEFQYDGSNKVTALLSSTATPVSRTLQLLSNGEEYRPNALDMFVSAFEAWRPLISEIGLLARPDPESEFLRMVYSYDDAP